MRLVEETFAPGMTVSLGARQHGIAPNQLFDLAVSWPAQGALTATGAEEEVVPASELPGASEPGARVATPARQEDLGSRTEEALGGRYSPGPSQMGVEF